MSKQLQFEVYLAVCKLGQAPYSRVVAVCENAKAARAICEALRAVYVYSLNWRAKQC